MPLAAYLAKASSSFVFFCVHLHSFAFICICLSLTLNRVIYDKQLHKICYSLKETYNGSTLVPFFFISSIITSLHTAVLLTGISTCLLLDGSV